MIGHTERRWKQNHRALSDGQNAEEAAVARQKRCFNDPLGEFPLIRLGMIGAANGARVEARVQPCRSLSAWKRRRHWGTAFLGSAQCDVRGRPATESSPTAAEPASQRPRDRPGA